MKIIPIATSSIADPNIAILLSNRYGIYHSYVSPSGSRWIVPPELPGRLSRPESFAFNEAENCRPLVRINNRRKPMRLKEMMGCEYYYLPEIGGDDTIGKLAKQQEFNQPDFFRFRPTARPP